MDPFWEGRIAVEQVLDMWRVLDPIRYYSRCGMIYDVPQDFLTDFASVPRVLWPIFPPSDPRWSAAAILHDRLYESHEVSRARADEILREFAGVLGCGWWRCSHLYAGVRVGGARAYRTGPARQRERVARYTALGLISPPLVRVAFGAIPKQQGVDTTGHQGGVA